MKTIVTGFKQTNDGFHVTFVHGDAYRSVGGGYSVSDKEAKGKTDMEICKIALKKVIDSLLVEIKKVNPIIGTEMDITGL